MFCSILLYLLHVLGPTMRGEERFREEGETAQKVGGGGRKDAKKWGEGRTSMEREKGECLKKHDMSH